MRSDDAYHIMTEYVARGQNRDDFWQWQKQSKS